MVTQPWIRSKIYAPIHGDFLPPLGLPAAIPINIIEDLRS